MEADLRTLGRDVDLAWAAGFFDGEGSITVYRRKEGFRCIACDVAQVDKRPLERFKAILGLGTIYGPKGNGKGAQPIHLWGTRNFAVAELVKDMLWPYLSEPKKEQWLKAIEKWQEFTPRGRP